MGSKAIRRTTEEYEEISKMLRLDEETGEIFWTVATVSNVVVGQRAGIKPTPKIYASVQYKGNKYTTHRVIYFMVTGENPEVVDHIDGDITNNKPSNLRSATFAENSMNIRYHTKNTITGITGITYSRKRDNYTACIRRGGKRLWQKTCKAKDLPELEAQLKQKRLEFGFSETHGETKCH